MITVKTHVYLSNHEITPLPGVARPDESYEDEKRWNTREVPSQSLFHAPKLQLACAVSLIDVHAPIVAFLCILSIPEVHMKDPAVRSMCHVFFELEAAQDVLGRLLRLS